MILCGYLKPQPVSSKVVPVLAVRNPFQGSTWQHWPHWSFCFTGAILASLKVVVVFRCFKSCSDTTIYFNLILQGRCRLSTCICFSSKSSGITFATPCNSAVHGSQSQLICDDKSFVRSLACSGTAPQGAQGLCSQPSHSGNERTSQEWYGCVQTLTLGLKES